MAPDPRQAACLMSARGRRRARAAHYMYMQFMQYHTAAAADRARPQGPKSAWYC